MKKPNLVLAGDIRVTAQPGEPTEPVKFALVIECANAEQVREAMKTGKIEFTKFEHYQDTPTKP